MRCEEVRDELLRCDPRVLAGEGDSSVARHLRECGECRAVAEALLDGQRGLARTLDAEAADADVDEAVERALGATEEDGGRHWRRWVVPLAAAAALVFALALPPEEDDGEPWPPAERRDPAPTPFTVEAAGDRPVTVLQTQDPDVTLVWFHEEREEAGQ